MITVNCCSVMMLSWDDVLEVELIDTNETTDVIIADDLVSRGHAQYKTNQSRKDKGTLELTTYLSLMAVTNY